MFEELVARQAGVVTSAQAAAHGYSADRVRRRVREGRWRRLHPGVVLVGGHRLTDEARTWAAWLWTGGSGIVSGQAAAQWHGMLARAPTDVELTVPTRAGLRSRPGVRVRRRDLADVDVVGARGLRVAGRGLTALEAAIAEPDGSAFLDRALQRHVPFEDVYGAYCRALGRRGSAEMARLLVAAADRADSAAERLLVRLLRAAGITGWELGHPCGPYLIDVAFPGVKVAVEVDGWAWHVDQDRFVNDRRKGNALVRAGWVLLRFTWHDLIGSPQRVLAQIVAALAQAP
ncbi:MAG TPA: type IV toxin-antitoxin system AbiEi family antitoxin domain-containing protein [Pseudonocardia sp.]